MSSPTTQAKPIVLANQTYTTLTGKHTDTHSISSHNTEQAGGHLSSLGKSVTQNDKFPQQQKKTEKKSASDLLHSKHASGTPDKPTSIDTTIATIPNNTGLSDPLQSYKQQPSQAASHTIIQGYLARHPKTFRKGIMLLNTLLMAFAISATFIFSMPVVASYACIAALVLTTFSLYKVTDLQFAAGHSTLTRLLIGVCSLIFAGLAVAACTYFAASTPVMIACLAISALPSLLLNYSAASAVAKAESESFTWEKAIEGLLNGWLDATVVIAIMAGFAQALLIPLLVMSGLFALFTAVKIGYKVIAWRAEDNALNNKQRFLEIARPMLHLMFFSSIVLATLLPIMPAVILPLIIVDFAFIVLSLVTTAVQMKQDDGQINRKALFWQAVLLSVAFIFPMMELLEVAGVIGFSFLEVVNGWADEIAQLLSQPEGSLHHLAPLLLIEGPEKFFQIVSFLVLKLPRFQVKVQAAHKQSESKYQLLSANAKRTGTGYTETGHTDTGY